MNEKELEEYREKMRRRRETEARNKSTRELYGEEE